MTALSLRIEIGNAAMQTADDAAAALENVATRLHAEYGPDCIDGWHGLGGWIVDANGNRVGRWVVDE